MRQGENQMGIRNRQQFGHAPPGPLLLGTSLAVGTVTIATGVIDIVAMAARIALQTMATQGRGPADSTALTPWLAARSSRGHQDTRPQKYGTPPPGWQT